MAHQTRVHKVERSFNPERPGEKVIDPVCGKQLDKASTKHAVYRTNEVLYFCSAECQKRFLDPAFKPPTEAA